MQVLRSGLSKLLSYSSIVITGLGIGWLVGLSVSPVVSIVITSVTGSAAAIIAAMSGVEKRTADTGQSEENKRRQMYWDVNPLPLAALVVGLVGGSMLGIYARNNNLLGPDISIAIHKWSRAGISEEEIVHRLFDIQLSPTGSNPKDTTPLTGSSGTGTILFTVSTEQCNTLNMAIARAEVEGDPDVLADAIRRIEQFKSLPDIVEDPECLKDIVEGVLCPQN